MSEDQTHVLTFVDSDPESANESPHQPCRSLSFREPTPSTPLARHGYSTPALPREDNPFFCYFTPALLREDASFSPVAARDGNYSTTSEREVEKVDAQEDIVRVV